MVGGSMKYFSGRAFVPRITGGTGIAGKIKNVIDKFKAMALAEASAAFKNASPVALLGTVAKGTKTLKNFRKDPKQMVKTVLGSALKHGAAGVSDVLKQKSTLDTATRTALRRTVKDIFTESSGQNKGKTGTKRKRDRPKSTTKKRKKLKTTSKKDIFGGI
jgi:hypothetical protein